MNQVRVSGNSGKPCSGIQSFGRQRFSAAIHMVEVRRRAAQTPTKHGSSANWLSWPWQVAAMAS